jgi:hypothetical protein
MVVLMNMKGTGNGGLRLTLYPPAEVPLNSWKLPEMYCPGVQMSEWWYRKSCRSEDSGMISQK